MNFNNKINAIFVIEVMGRPPEHLTATLDDLAKKIGEENGIKIKETKINTPVLMKDQKDFYTSFAEIEIEAEKIISLVILMFKYMPAHIEILSPQNISLTNAEWGDILSELTRRLHGYDEVARILQTEKNILEKRLKEVMDIKKQGTKSPTSSPEASSNERKSEQKVKEKKEKNDD